MRPGRGVLLVPSALAIVAVPLLLLDADERASGFRIAVVLVGILVLRTIADVTASAPAPPPDSPFVPRRRRRRRSKVVPARTPLDSLVISATERSGQFHHRLRPALREIANERLQARHGLTIDDAAAETALGSVAWEHLRANRPEPVDRRSPGLDEATLRTIFDAVEAL